MRQRFANTSAFSEPALFVRRAYKVKAGKRKADLRLCLRTPESLRRRTKRGAVVSFRDQPDGECYSRETSGFPYARTRERKPVGCHNLCKPKCCSKAGLLMTHRKTFQCASPTRPPPSASLWDMPFHILPKIKSN